MSMIKSLLSVIDAYGMAGGHPDTKTSWRVFGDSKKVAALRSGADIQVTRAEAALQWFADNWPDGAEWPKGVDRPSPTSGASAEAVAAE
jgi:hypothetical protein